MFRTPPASIRKFQARIRIAERGGGADFTACRIDISGIFEISKQRR